MNLGGRALETAWWGPGPEVAPTIVLLHEGLGSLGLWRNFPAALAEATGCGVFAYSRFGYGRSAPCPLPRPLDYMRREAVDVLPGVLDRAGVRRAVLLGHSDGGSIAAIHAGSVGDFRVRGLVLVAPHFFVEEMGLAAIRDARRAWHEGDLRGKLARWHDDPDIAFRGWNEAWLDPGFRAFDLTADLAHVRVPMLVLQGTEDPYGTPAQLELAARETYCPCETLLLPGLRHAPHLEAPERVLPVIRDFLHRLLAVHEGAAVPAA